VRKFLIGELSLKVGCRVKPVVDALCAVSVNKRLIKSALGRRRRRRVASLSAVVDAVGRKVPQVGGKSVERGREADAAAMTVEK